MKKGIRNFFKKAVRFTQRTYDAAQIHRHTQNHWINADAKDADSLITPALPILRNRARYEIRNNTYAAGIVDTLSNDVVGSGPRLQINSKNKSYNARVENEFNTWAADCG